MLFATMGIVHLLFWLYNRRIVSNLLFSIFSISLSLCILTDLLAFLTHSPTTIWFSRIYSPYIILVCCVSLSAFINSLFGKHGTRFRSIAGYAILLAGLYAFDVPGLNAFAKPLFFGAIALETITLTLRAIFRGVKGARIIGAGMLCFAAFALVTALIALVSKQPLSFDEHTAIGHVILVSITASIVAMPVSMSAYLAWNFSNVNKRLQRELMQVETLSERARQQEEEKRRLLESRQEELEREVTVRTEEIRNQKKKSDDLLLNILPEEVAEELKEKGSAEARHFNDVSVLFTDFVDFTKHSEMLTPAAIVAELHTCFKAFDEITTRYGLEKIKTIGDAYMAVAGVPVPQQGHAAATVQAALDILDYIARRRKDFPSSFDIRIGVHSGPVVAGIVGVKKFAYDIWGDTVNTAARMQQSAEPGKINVSQSTYDQIKDYYQCSFRGEIAAKNKGNMRMYFVDSKVSELVGEPL
jgi:class 3 adenylate cyclase